jgi:hypothetical protein
MNEAMDPYVQMAQHCVHRFLTTFAHVPDDKLNWTPSPTAKTPLQIAAHTGHSLHTIAARISGAQATEGQSREDVIARSEAAERAITTREEAVKAIEEGLAAAVAALHEVTADRLESMTETPFGSMPMRFIVSLPGRHTDNHASQIDYLQTTWGDFGFYMR